MKDTTIVVWNAGPRQGRICRILPRLPAETIKTMPRKADILAEIDRRLREVDRLESLPPREARAAHLARAIRELQEAIGRRGEDSYIRRQITSMQAELATLPPPQPVPHEVSAELFTFLFRRYYGLDGQPGWETTRLEDPELLELIATIEKEGLRPWLQARARTLGLKAVDMERISALETGAINDLFYGRTSERDNGKYPNSQQGIRLTHGTFSVSLSGVLNERALVPDQKRDPGIPKLSGEGGAVGHGATPEFVSFWDKQSAGTKWLDSFPVPPGYSSTEGFAFPMVWGISVAEAKKLNLRPEGFNYLPDEQRVKGRVPLARVTHVFVPYFKVEEMRTYLSTNGAGHIEVLPMGFTADGKPRWAPLPSAPP